MLSAHCFVFLVLLFWTAESSDQDLIRRIEALELQLNKQQRVIEIHETKIKQYEAKLAECTSTNEPSETHKNAAETPSNEETTGPAEAKEFDGVTLSDNLTEAIYRRTSEDQLNLQRRLLVDSGEGPIAFHATNDKLNTNVGLNQHILFEDVQLNAGNGFHVLHGLFIAQRAGIYIFSTSIMAAPGQGDVLASIEVNGADIARAYAVGNSGHDQGSVTIVVQLKAGDEVWVKSYDRPNAAEYGDKFSSFMGCLVMEI